MDQPGKSAAAYLKHYESLFGNPTDMHVYGSDSFPTPFYVMQYDKVLPLGHLLLSAGLSDYAEQIGSRIEVALRVDQYVDEIGDFLITALHFAVREKLQIGDGFSLQGLSAVNSALANAIGKEAIYFTKLRGIRDGLAAIPGTEPPARVLSGVLISASENEFFLDHGAEDLESTLTESVLTDPSVKRAPIV
jgi:hypothetical protein